MTQTTRVLAALLIGLLAGLMMLLYPAPAFQTVVAFVEPIGILWVNAIRMTVVPLVVSLLITGVASTGDARVMRDLGLRALVTFVGLLVLSALVGFAVAPWLFQWLPVDAGTVALMRGTGAAAAASARADIPTFAQWIVEVIPANPIRTAADAAMLPLVVFALIFGLALLKVAPDRRASVVSFFQGVGDAMLAIVDVVIALAPIGVFALMLPVASRTGMAAAGALGYYIIAVAVATAILVATLYPVTALLGRISMVRFASAALPPQAVAVSSSSSLASLPALIDSGDRRLHLPQDITAVVLPLAVSSFKATAPLMWMTAAMFLAKLYGVSVSAGQLAIVAATSFIASFSSPGVPHGWLLVITPLLATLGIPPEGVGLLIAVDAVPDMFITTGNVTADLAAAAIVARGARAQSVAGVS